MWFKRPNQEVQMSGNIFKPLIHIWRKTHRQNCRKAAFRCFVLSSWTTGSALVGVSMAETLKDILMFTHVTFNRPIFCLPEVQPLELQPARSTASPPWSLAGWRRSPEPPPPPGHCSVRKTPASWRSSLLHGRRRLDRRTNISSDWWLPAY